MTGGQEGEDLVLDDLPENTSSRLTQSQVERSLRYSPRKLVWTLDDEEWEQLVYEWARVIPGYSAVRRFTGSGDMGRDVVAFVDGVDLFADWDCYQCKHYAQGLTPSEAWPEIFKILDAVVREKFALPRRYFFVSPREPGPALKGYFADSSSFLTDFQVATSTKAIQDKYSGARIAAVLEFANEDVMGRFDYVPIVELLEQFKGSPNYLSWFGGGLPTRSLHEAPPEDVASLELVYVAKLLDVYNEHSAGAQYSSAAEVALDTQKARHLQRQRESFYSAEALEKFARDVSPDGTFKQLQKELYDAVIECHDDDVHADGMSRLRGVLEVALAAQITSSPLMSEVLQADRKGICHQLANDDELTWVRSLE